MKQGLPEHRFVQICAGFHSELFALDAQGFVWKYYPARAATAEEKERFKKDKVYARWGRLTSYRMDPDSNYKTQQNGASDEA